MAIQLISNYRKHPHNGILQTPDKNLRRKSEAISKMDASTKTVVERLNAILKDLDKPYKPWLGIAAPQVGVNQQIVVIKTAYHTYKELINPEITSQKLLLPTVTACLSLKGIYLTKSHYFFRIKYQDLKGEYHEENFIGPTAVLMQQELDHLNGKLVCD